MDHSRKATLEDKCQHIPGEKMSGLKRMSNEVSLIEPTALQALRTTSRLLGSVDRHRKSNMEDSY